MLWILNEENTAVHIRNLLKSLWVAFVKFIILLFALYNWWIQVARKLRPWDTERMNPRNKQMKIIWGIINVSR